MSNELKSKQKRKLNKVMKKVQKIMNVNDKQKLTISNKKEDCRRVIIVEGEFKGLFFRKPIIKKEYRVDGIYYVEQENENCLFCLIEEYDKNLFFRLFFNLIGNKERIKNAKEAIKKDDGSLAGFVFNYFVSPIYFKREGVKSIIIDIRDEERLLDGYKPNNSRIFTIISKGYEEQFNLVAGRCKKEVTKVYNTKGKVISKITKKRSYCYVYEHYIRELYEALRSNETNLFEGR